MSNDIKIKKTTVTDITFVIASVTAIVILFVLYNLYPDFLKHALLPGLFVYIGLLLPRFIGRKTREERVRKAKQSEYKKWLFQSRDRDGPWINYIDYPLFKYTDDSRFQYQIEQALNRKAGDAHRRPATQA